MAGYWLYCQFCERGSQVNAYLVESGTCFSCYMKGLGPWRESA